VKGYLLDENLPSRLRFVPRLPVTHATELGPQPTDQQVWDYARIHDPVVVTKDADFSNRILVSTPPPRVIHVRVGNLRRQEFHALLAKVWPRIESLGELYKLVNVYPDYIEVVA